MNRSSEKIYLESNAQGDNVRKLLKSKNIKSPSIKNKVLIAPGFWLIPNKKINSKKELKKFIDEKRKKIKFD